MVIVFNRDEDAYLAWLAKNPHGFVVNTYQKPDSSYLILHRASCASISNDAKPPGGFTERDYIKICALTIDELRAEMKSRKLTNGSFSKECGLCKP